MVLLWIAVVSSRHCLCSLKDLKANESRLKDINKVAEDLESEGLMAEEVQAVQQQVGVWLLRGACLGAAWLPRSLCCSPARVPHSAQCGQRAGSPCDLHYLVYLRWEGKTGLLLRSLKYHGSC